jgi:hypothetical protein
MLLHPQQAASLTTGSGIAAPKALSLKWSARNVSLANKFDLPGAEIFPHFCLCLSIMISSSIDPLTYVFVLEQGHDRVLSNTTQCHNFN